MSLIKTNSFLASLMILVAVFGVAIGDSLVSEYNKDYHDVTEVTPNIFEQCEPSNPQENYQTGSESVTLMKPRVQNFVCGVPGHCGIGQKLQISLGPVAARVPRPVGSPRSSLSPLADSPVNNGPKYQMGPSPAPHSAASNSSAWIGFYFLLLNYFYYVLRL